MINIGITKKDRKIICESLSRFLADIFILYIKTHGYHWNVTGVTFKQLHSLFGEQYEELLEAADAVAERMRALDFYAPASFTEYLKTTTLDEERGVPEAHKMVRQLCADHESMVRRANEVCAVAESLGDNATADLMIERMRKHSHHAWMLRSHTVGSL